METLVCSIVCLELWLPLLVYRESPLNNRHSVPHSLSVWIFRRVSSISSFIIRATPSFCIRCFRSPASVNLSNSKHFPWFSSTDVTGYLHPNEKHWFLPPDGGQMHKVNKLKFSLYVGVICNLLSPRRAEMVERMDINMSSLAAPWAFAKTSSHAVKYGGEIFSHGRVNSAALTATSFIHLSSTFAVFVKRIRLGVCEAIIYDRPCTKYNVYSDFRPEYTIIGALNNSSAFSRVCRNLSDCHGDCRGQSLSSLPLD